MSRLRKEELAGMVVQDDQGEAVGYFTPENRAAALAAYARIKSETHDVDAERIDGLRGPAQAKASTRVSLVEGSGQK